MRTLVQVHYPKVYLTVMDWLLFLALEGAVVKFLFAGQKKMDKVGEVHFDQNALCRNEQHPNCVFEVIIFCHVNSSKGKRLHHNPQLNNCLKSCFGASQCCGNTCLHV